eukprot:TRINITY_DN16131_c0_g3_i2.p1 TRINITY_DN16131_c0_g3~~TRINITY_DN16131_c0_g3_i2.p1  ORF type:complete len:161 (+),score=22.49 TRINITY_DN16131_c0_g3_i2:217-699(+)
MSAGYASDAAGTIIQLKVTTLAGDAFEIPMPSDASGNDLFEALAKECACHGSQKVPLVFLGETLVSLSDCLASQVDKHGSDVTLTFRPVQQAEQDDVAKKIWDGESLNAQELHIWHSIVKLDMIPRVPTNYVLPTYLHSLTFANDFNQSMEKVSLPTGAD